ncbi:MAG: arginine--tRNA ligase [Patescibacteria group bacterium]
MTQAWKFWTHDIAERLSKQLGVEVRADELVAPPDPTMGDFAFPCFRLAKERKVSPAVLAAEIVQDFQTAKTDIAGVTVAGPYVNFTLNVGDAVHRVVRDIEVAGADYGKGGEVPQGQILFEHANPNTHKEIHVGHTRLLVLGASILNILRSWGANPVSLSYVNDVGANVGKVLWFFVKRAEIDPRTLDLERAIALVESIHDEDQGSRFLGAIYTEATKFVDEHPEVKDELSFVQQQLEAHDKAWEFLWRETRRWCIEELYQIFDELGVKIDRQYFESDILDRAQEIVADLEKKGIAVKSEGALVVDLEQEKLGVSLLRKTDGNLLYSAKDLALAEQKQQDYPGAEKSVYLVDARQSLYLKQLFATLKRMGATQHFEHIGFEIVTLKEGVMSSRKGNVITYQQFRDAVVDEARSGIMARHEDWPERKVADAAWKIAMAAIKFTMLKQDSDKQIVFDLKQALSFEGSTGPYCQYAATRLGSIVKKAPQLPSEDAPLTNAFSHISEKRLALTLATFPAVLERAAQERKPSVVAQWCVDTAQRVGDFYRDVSVLDAEPAIRDGRLRLCMATRAALERGLALLGIGLPEEM